MIFFFLYIEVGDIVCWCVFLFNEILIDIYVFKVSVLNMYIILMY